MMIRGTFIDESFFYSYVIKQYSLYGSDWKIVK